MKFPAIAFLALVHAGGTAHAAVLANYDFTSNTTTNGALSTANVATPTTNYTASSFQAGLGLQGNVPGSTPSPGFSITGQSTTGGNSQHMFVRIGGTDSTSSTDQAGAVAANDYYSFTVTAASGFALNLTSLTFDIAHGTTSSVFVRSSLDGFSETLLIETSDSTGSVFSAADPLLFGSSFQNLTGPVEFRFYFADGTTSTTNNSLVSSRLDNIVLNGDVIPEPSAALLFGLAALPLLARRKR